MVVIVIVIVIVVVVALHRIHQTLLGSHSIQFLVGNRKAQMTLINQLIVGSALSLLLYGIASEDRLVAAKRRPPRHHHLVERISSNFFKLNK